MFEHMPGRVKHLNRHVTEREHVPITSGMERGRSVRFGKQHLLGTGGFGQPSPRRHMIGVNVRVDDIQDAHPSLLGGFDIPLDVPNRIDHCRRGLAATAEQIGNRHGRAWRNWRRFIETSPFLGASPDAPRPNRPHYSLDKLGRLQVGPFSRLSAFNHSAK